MSIQLILGGSGAGKSHMLCRRIIEEAKAAPDKRFLVIVPEQFTLQTQLEYVRMHDDGGIINIDVLSFERLAYRVFEEMGKDRVNVLRDTGKSLLLRKAALEIADELEVFGGNFRKPGYVREMKSLLSELSQYKVGPGELEELIEKLGDRQTLSRKLSDIRKLQIRFFELLGSDSITGEQLLEELAVLLPGSGTVRGSVVALDGYTGFTPIQRDVVAQLIRLADKVYVTAEVDEKENINLQETPQESLFFMGKRMALDCMRMADEAGVPILDEIRLLRPYPRFREEEGLSFLEEHFFRRNCTGRFSGDQSAVRIHRNRNPKEEARFAASETARLIRSGLKCRDIAVIAGSMEDYGNEISLAFHEWGIPLFLDEKKDILRNACIEWIIGAVALAEERFSYESVFRYLKTGMSGWEEEDIFLLEDYVLALGVRGFGQWEEKWIRKPKRFSEEDLARAEALRQKLLDETGSLIASLRDRKRTVGSMTRALYEHMVSCGIQVRLARREEQFLSEGRADIAKEYSQIYSAVMGLFDQFVLLLGEERVTPKEYRELLEAGLSDLRLGIIPPGRDQVVAGDMERTRLADVKVLFFLGFNEQYLPGNLYRGGILTDAERRFLGGADIKLSPDTEERTYMQQFYLYYVLTKPKERLYLTYSNVSMDGKPMRSSYYLRELERLFPDIPVTDEVIREKVRDIPLSERSALSYLADGLSGQGLIDNYWKELYRQFLLRNEAKKASSLVRARYVRPLEKEPVSVSTAEMLYGRHMRISVSALEMFAQCPYEFFCRYGLRLEERELFTFRPADEGTVLHQALYLYGKMLEQEGLSWFGVPEDKQEEYLNRALSDAALRYGNEVLLSTGRSTYKIRRMENTFRKAVWANTRQLEAGCFEPAGYELGTESGGLPGIDIPLADGKTMKLIGKIDRLDTASLDGTTYLKVLDYKTYDMKTDLSQIWHGLDLQLFLYLDLAKAYAEKQGRGEKVVPAGVFYYHVKDPVLYKEKTHGDPAMDVLMELRPSGLVNADLKVLPLFDRAFSEPGTKKSAVIRVEKKNGGELKKSDSLISADGFELLNERLSEKITDYGSRIAGGQIEALPAVSKGSFACDKCRYASACAFKVGAEGCRAKWFAPLSPEEIFAGTGKEERNA